MGIATSQCDSALLSPAIKERLHLELVKKDGRLSLRFGLWMNRDPVHQSAFIRGIAVGVALLAAVSAAKAQSATKSTWTFTPSLKRLDASSNELSAGTVTLARTDTMRVGLYITVSTDAARTDANLGFDLLVGGIHFSSDNGLAITDIGPVVRTLRAPGNGWTSGLVTSGTNQNSTFDGTEISVLGPPEEAEDEDSWVFLWLDIDSISDPRGAWCEPSLGSCEIFLGVLEVSMAQMPLTAAGTLSVKVAGALSATDSVEVGAFHSRGIEAVGAGNSVSYSIAAESTSIAPSLSLGSVNGNTLVLTFNSNLDEGSVPGAGDFEVYVEGTRRDVTAVSVSATKVTLTLASPVSNGETVTVNYTVPTGATAEPLQNPAGTDVAAFMDEDVMNNTPAYMLSVADAELAENASPGTMEFVVTVSPSASQAAITVDYETGATGDTATEDTDYTDASGTLTIPAGDTTGTISVSVTDDTAGEGDESFTLTLSNPSGATLTGDVMELAATGTIEDDEPAGAPELSTARAIGREITLTYDKPLDENSTPATTAFTVEAAEEGETAAEVTVNGVEVDGYAVTLTLVSEVTLGQTVTLDYEVPATNPIQDLAGMDAAELTDQAVTVGPALSDLDVNMDGSFDATDTQAMSYAYTLTFILGDGMSGGFPNVRQAVLSDLAQSPNPTDADLQQILANANDLRSGPVLSDLDVNMDGSFDATDTQAMSYAYTLTFILGDGMSGGFPNVRQAVLSDLAQSPNPTDADLQQILRKANDLLEATR